MEDKPTGTSGEGEQAVSDPSLNTSNDVVDQKPDTVKYDTYKKVLSEKKRRDDQLKQAQDQIAEFQKAEKERTENELKQKEDYKQLLEMREQEIAELKTGFTTLQAQQQNATKLDSFLGTLDGKVDRKYWGMIDLDKIIIDPETGVADEMSVTKAVEGFKKEYPELVQTKGAPKVSSEAPRPVSGGVGESKNDILSDIAASGLF